MRRGSMMTAMLGMLMAGHLSAPYANPPYSQEDLRPRRKRSRARGRRKRRLKHFAKLQQIMRPIPPQQKIGARKYFRRFTW